jgi:hypothetical protein
VQTPDTYDMKRSDILVALFVIVVFIFLALAFLFAPGTDSLKVSIVSRTSDSTGITNIEVKVTNFSRRIVNFAFWVEVLKDGKWVEDELWDPKMKGQLHWVAGHESRSIQLHAPADSSIWRFKIMEMEQPTALRWKWLAFWEKARLKSEPRQWYLYLDSDK